MSRTVKIDPLVEAMGNVPSEEVEAAAKAVYEHRFNRSHDIPWEKCGPTWQAMHRTDAAIAIAAASLVNDNPAPGEGEPSE